MPTLLDARPSPYDADAAYTAFVEWSESRGLALYPAQDEALIELVSGANVILSTPTGTGKSPGSDRRPTSWRSLRVNARTTPRPSRRS